MPDVKARCTMVPVSDRDPCWCLTHSRSEVECLRAERYDLLRSAKLLLLCFYGHIPGPFTDSMIAREAEEILERIEGKEFDGRQWMIDLAAESRKKKGVS